MTTLSIKTTQAHEYRCKHANLTTINGHTSEYLTHWPDKAEKHPESNELAQGFIFSDGSEIWETDHNGIRSLFTTAKR